MTTATMSPELAEVIGGVQVELGNWIDLIDGEGAEYARCYAWWLLTGSPRSQQPSRPPAMHHKIAAAIRDVVVEEAMTRRRLPARGRR